MEVNFFAPAELTRNLLPCLMLGKSPVICNIGSVLGHRAVPDKSEYCASNFAMHGWSDALRAELFSTGIQVTLVSPSTTRSEFFDSLIDTAPNQSSRSLGHWSAERVADSTATGIPPLGPACRVRVFRFNRPRVAVCAPSELRFDYQPLFSTF